MNRRLASVALLAALLALAAGQTSDGGTTTLSGAPGSSSDVTLRDKLAPELKHLRANDDTLHSVIVRFREQADLSSISIPAKQAKRRAVIGLLERTAAQNQRRSLALLAQRRAEVAHVTSYWVFNGLAVRATGSVLGALAELPEVASITLDANVELTAREPESISTVAEPNIELVNAPDLWGLGYRGQGVVVANMDTGVDATHPDLASHWRGGSNSWYDPNGQHTSGPVDVNGHGTWTMGVMVGGNAGGTAIGMAPDAQWIAVKIFNDAGVATTSGIHAGFQWLLDPDGNPATDDAADVVNNSWTLSSIGCNLEFAQDIASLRAALILPVFAAGNFGPNSSTSSSPGNNPGALAVGATNDLDAIWSSSGRGPSACGEPQTTFPEVVAPGVDVRTSDLYGLYFPATGTSLAAPHVAGALALLLDAFPGLSVEEQASALESGAADLGSTGPDDTFGYGRLDVLASHNWLGLHTSPDFVLGASPSSASTTPSGSAAYTIYVSPLDGFTGDVSLSLSGLSSSQATWSFQPDRIAGGSGSSLLAVTTSGSLPPGSYPLTITGTSGSLVHTTSVTLVVRDFALSISPSTRSVSRGKATSYSVNISSLNGFAGAVQLAANGLPTGATATFTPATLNAPGTSTLKVSTTRSTPRGTFTLTVTGASGPTVRQSTALLRVT